MLGNSIMVLACMHRAEQWVVNGTAVRFIHGASCAWGSQDATD